MEQSNVLAMRLTAMNMALDTLRLEGTAAKPEEVLAVAQQYLDFLLPPEPEEDQPEFELRTIN